MKKLLARLLLFLSSGLLLGHALIPHHHIEETVAFISIHEDDGHAHEHAFFHDIDDVFLPTIKLSGHFKWVVKTIGFITPSGVTTDAVLCAQHVYRQEIEIRPPILPYYDHFSLRAPPAC